MVDEPDVKTLLEAMAATLTDQVVPSCAGGAHDLAHVYTAIDPKSTAEFRSLSTSRWLTSVGKT